MKKYLLIVSRLSILIALFAGLLGTALEADAQSLLTWSPPTNLSNSGFASSPLLVADSSGTLHAMWIDQFEGYKYSKSTDGVSWTSPKAVRFPFAPDPAVQPLLLTDQVGGVHAFWRTIKNELFYSTAVAELDVPSKWTGTTKLADLVIDFDAVISSQGVVHVVFENTAPAPTNKAAPRTIPAGVYFLQRKGFNWSSPQSLYPSQYLRSLTPDQANVHLAVSEANGTETVYAVWDDRPQKRIFMSRSLDGGALWESHVQIRSAEDNPGLEAPFNINVDAGNGNVLLLWQSGVPGGNCAQYGQWSANGGVEFQPPVRMPGILNGCPQVSNFLTGSDELPLVWLNTLDDISLIAWNGSGWGEPQPQSAVTTFTNPLTLDTVFYGCQKPAVFKGQLNVVGCDKGSSADIWFSSRPLGTLQDWFPPSWAWSAPAEVASVAQQLSAPTSAADGQNNIHTFWVETSVIDGLEGASTIQYIRANDEGWSSPVTIISEAHTRPIQLNAISDAQSRLLLSWVDRNTGDIFFSWAESQNADKPSEWSKPQYIPSASQTNSSPDFLADGAGKILVTYAIPVNEQRGIYVVESSDGGTTWTQPLRIFDAASPGWEMVDRPNLSLTGDGRLHLLFRRYAFQEETRRSLGLYYAQSSDGGITWTDPEVVSEHPVVWSDVVAYGPSILHRIWQEQRQAMLVSFHQISGDNGLTWSSPVILSSVQDDPSLTVQTIDKAGNLYFLQLSNEDRLKILDHTWNGSGWTSQEPKEFYIKDRGTPTALTAGVSSQGNLRLSVLVSYPDLTGQAKSGIWSLGKTLQLPPDVLAPAPAILPGLEASVVVTEPAADPLQSPTQVSPLQNLNRSSRPISANKNLVGVLLLGGIVVLLVIIFRPFTRPQANPKKSTE
jgi:hypothetical protein